jgi:cytochrome b involved in lipid metabolism
MKELITDLFNNFGQKLAMFLLVGTTALTTGTAVSKVVIKQTGAEQKTPQEIAVELPDSGSDSKNVEIEDRKITLFKDDSTILPKIIPTKSKSATPTPAPTSIPKATVTTTKTAAAVDTTNRCIITLFGKSYDISNLRSTHSGGDVFTCGADMTSKYQGKHGSSVSMMSRYAYDPNNPTTVSPSSSGSSSNSIDDDEEEEREDKRNEDRYEDREDHEDEEDED